MTYTGKSSFICNLTECSAFLFANSGNPISEWESDCSKIEGLVIFFYFLPDHEGGCGGGRWGIKVPFPLYFGSVSRKVFFFFSQLKNFFLQTNMSQAGNIRFFNLTMSILTYISVNYTDFSKLHCIKNFSHSFLVIRQKTYSALQFIEDYSETSTFSSMSSQQHFKTWEHSKRSYSTCWVIKGETWQDLNCS